MKRSIMLAVLAVNAVMLWAGLLHADIRAVPKRPGKVYTPSKAPEKPKSSSEYDKLLVKYLRNIEAVARERQERRIRDYRKSLQRCREADEDLRSKKPEVLEKIRQENRTMRQRNLPLEGEILTYTAIIPNSAASAEVYDTLLKENIAEPQSVASVLFSKASILSKEWISILQDIAAKAESDSQAGKWAIRALYRAGVSRDQYRPTLERQARRGDVVALDVLFFDADKQTGEPVKVATPDNFALMKELAGGDSPPEIRVTCAHFANEVGNKALAESICTELMSQRYKGMDNPDAKPPESDRVLGRARETAMYLMFYGIKSERMFKLIYDRSRIVDTERAENKGKPRGSWKSLEVYVLGLMEIETAQSLIRGV